MTAKPTLKLDWCSHEAAKYAVEKWHYSKSMPAGKLAMIGVWEAGEYVGCVLYGRGANRNAGSPYGLDVTTIAELVRVALRRHATPVSRILAVANRMLKASSPGLRLLFSYADPLQLHHGGIYQAAGWVYTGRTDSLPACVTPSGVMHRRSAHAKYGHVHGMLSGIKLTKHKYLMPLDAAMRAQILPLSKPYPKKTRAGSDTLDTPANHAGEGSAILTPALHTHPTPIEVR